MLLHLHNIYSQKFCSDFYDASCFFGFLIVTISTMWTHSVIQAAGPISLI